MSGPTGGSVRVARGTLDRWVRDYRRGGFEALLPRRRVVAPRTPAEVLELAFSLKRERPERTAAQVREIMLAAGGDDERVPGLRTLQTHLARAGLNVRADGRAREGLWPLRSRCAQRVVDGGWVARPHAGRCRCSAGGAVGFIDDHSRLLVGWRWAPARTCSGSRPRCAPD